MQNPEEKVKVEYVKPEVIATYSEQELEAQVVSVYGADFSNYHGTPSG